MKDAVWRALSYVAFFGLFTRFYGRGDVARHGRRGFLIFIWEVVALVVVDVVRLKAGWPLVIFAPVLSVLAVVKIILIVRAVVEGRAGSVGAVP
jgi:hypothetical protein